MNKRTGIVILALVLVGLTICGACAIAVGVVGLGPMATRMLGAGPDGIDLRPTPGTISPQAALPAEVAGYERRSCRSVAEFRGVALGPEAVEARYSGPRGTVRVVAALLGSYHDAASAVSELAAQLDQVGSLDSHRLVTEEPPEGLGWSGSKRNFALWHAPGWGRDRHGLAWQSGGWCFILVSDDPVARRDVSLAFPY